MKKTWKIIATVSSILFVILWITSYFNVWQEFNSMDMRNTLLVIYLFTSLQYFQMEAKDKNAEIKELRLKMENLNREI
ncbi:MAG: hypothetical protein ACXWCF_05325 [Kaistella sp.]